MAKACVGVVAVPFANMYSLFGAEPGSTPPVVTYTVPLPAFCQQSVKAAVDPEVEESKFS